MKKEKNKLNCHCEEHSATRQSNEIASHSFAMTEQCGRSMVEMLGVLAVIGVLSVAGIAGYSIAMRNHRANEVLNAASMLYVMAMAKNQGTGADTNYSELGTAPSGTTLAYTASDKKITITFTNEEDCKQAKNKLGDKALNDCTPATAPATGYNLTVNFGEVSESTEGFEYCEECYGESCTEIEAEAGTKKCSYRAFGGGYIVVECLHSDWIGGYYWDNSGVGNTYQDNRCTQVVED